MIGPEKAGLLCELLDEIGRKDLTAIVKEYMDKLDCKYTIHNLTYHKATCELNLSKYTSYFVVYMYIMYYMVH